MHQRKTGQNAIRADQAIHTIPLVQLTNLIKGHCTALAGGQNLDLFVRCKNALDLSVIIFDDTEDGAEWIFLGSSANLHDTVHSALLVSVDSVFNNKRLGVIVQMNFNFQCNPPKNSVQNFNSQTYIILKISKRQDPHVTQNITAIITIAETCATKPRCKTCLRNPIANARVASKAIAKYK